MSFTDAGDMKFRSICIIFFTIELVILTHEALVL